MTYCIAQKPLLFQFSKNVSQTEWLSYLNLKNYVFGFKTLRKVVIAFRGTEDMTDARIDMQFSFDAFDSSLDQNIHVHSGFKTQYQSIKDKVRQYVSDKCDQYHPRQLLITGHSLGGALATLCSLDLIRDSFSSTDKFSHLRASNLIQNKEHSSDFSKSTNDKSSIIWRTPCR